MTPPWFLNGARFTAAQVVDGDDIQKVALADLPEQHCAYMHFDFEPRFLLQFRDRPEEETRWLNFTVITDVLPEAGLRWVIDETSLPRAVAEYVQGAIGAQDIWLTGAPDGRCEIEFKGRELLEATQTKILGQPVEGRKFRLGGHATCRMDPFLKVTKRLRFDADFGCSGIHVPLDTKIEPLTLPVERRSVTDAAGRSWRIVGFGSFEQAQPSCDKEGQGWHVPSTEEARVAHTALFGSPIRKVINTEPRAINKGFWVTTANRPGDKAVWLLEDAELTSGGDPLYSGQHGKFAQVCVR